MNHHKAIKGLTVLLIVLIVAAGVVLYTLYGTYKAIKDNPMAAFATPQASAVASDDLKFDNNANVETVTIDGKTYQKKQNVVTVLMLGIDSDGSAAKNAQGERSDMMMLCTVDMDANTIELTSRPRDTRTTVHDVDTKTGKIKDKTWVTKLNHAYNRGGGQDKYGAENAMRATEDLIECDGQLSIPVSYFVSIDLEHLSDLADALGGVEVTLDQDYPDIGSKGDTITLEGNNVRLYLQNRKQMDDGEMSRQKHEQDFMMAIAKKIKKLGAVESASRLFTQLQDVVKMDLNLDQIVGMAGVLDKVSLDEIKRNSFTENYKMMNDELMGQDLDFFVMDEDELMDMMLEMYYTPVDGGSARAAGQDDADASASAKASAASKGSKLNSSDD